MPLKKTLRGLLLLPALALLAGCNAVLLHPEGDVALQQRDLIIVSLGLMLLIVIPVIALTLFFAWRYRARNTQASYDPEWHHSTMLELMIWAAPLLIIIALGALTWVSTHKLDPYRPLDQLSKGRLVAAGTQPLVVEVVALDWKWLFFYPEQGIATVNELAAPVDRPIEFRITATNVMNSFFIPSLAGQIYAMPGMETTLHAVMNKVGVYKGFSSNFSGDGFSGMHFQFHGMTAADFDCRICWYGHGRSTSRKKGTVCVMLCGSDYSAIRSIAYTTSCPSIRWIRRRWASALISGANGRRAILATHFGNRYASPKPSGALQRQ